MLSFLKVKIYLFYSQEHFACICVLSLEVRIGVTDDCGLSFACEKPNPGALRVTITGHLSSPCVASLKGNRCSSAWWQA